MANWMALHPFIVLCAWFMLGLLAWGWMNYCAYKDDPSADLNPKKWSCLVKFMVFGLVSLLVVFFVMLGDRKLCFGLRFK